MEFQDYYAVLDVPRTATEKEIRSAFRKLARKYHPDVNPGDKGAEDRFKQINEAYEVLSDPEKRKRYDELGSRYREYEQAQRAGGAAGTGGEPFDWSGFASSAPDGARYEYRSASAEDLRDMFGDESPFSDFFEELFGSGAPSGGRRAGTRPRRASAGADLEHPVEISFTDAYKGTTIDLTMREADGKTKRLEVKIPPGVDNGSRVRIAGQGQPGRDGGARGDLYLVMSIRPDPRFERRGRDLHAKVHAPLTVLLLGGEARVSTPDGRTLALTIPAGTQDGRVFRLRGQGMPSLGKPDRRGDLHAEVHARLPERLSARERELVEELARQGSGTTTGVSS